ncbi:MULTISPECIES: rubredoxin [Pseudomonas]|jgi:rubredoxin|uniref:rubredoxin n=1 Tax=Pseudomonas TaxID=286 RepID=UPI001119A116|nr:MULTISPECIES: rubredoxin [Pseudomonas]MDF9754772.1 rubredoxin [Pseudomonas hunanensis]UVL18868.1 rubredoxin [Pseudomonas sp. B21-044]UVM16280.1 rubredoxin [Pseudomonas sp. B21-023]
MATQVADYYCETCWYTYDPTVGDPEHGIAPGTAFEDIPHDWLCPDCGLGKEAFVPRVESLDA